VNHEVWPSKQTPKSVREAPYQLNREVWVGVVDSLAAPMCTRFTLPISLAGIASFSSNQPRHRRSPVSSDSSQALARGGRQQ
jgi:hypothetical protein